MTPEDSPAGPLDVATLEVLGRRAVTHPLVREWTLQPDAVSPRFLELRLDAGQYPRSVERSRLDVRWFEGGDYTIHYVESHDDAEWQCRWDRHPKPGSPTSHFHPPPDAAPEVEPSPIDATHHLGVLFAVLDRVSDRLETVHGT